MQHCRATRIGPGPRRGEAAREEAAAAKPSLRDGLPNNAPSEGPVSEPAACGTGGTAGRTPSNCRATFKVREYLLNKASSSRGEARPRDDATRGRLLNASHAPGAWAFHHSMNVAANSRFLH
jgi:hypothetical protein